MFGYNLITQRHRLIAVVVVAGMLATGFAILLFAQSAAGEPRSAEGQPVPSERGSTKMVTVSDSVRVPAPSLTFDAPEGWVRVNEADPAAEHWIDPTEQCRVMLQQVDVETNQATEITVESFHAMIRMTADVHAEHSRWVELPDGQHAEFFGVQFNPKGASDHYGEAATRVFGDDGVQLVVNWICHTDDESVWGSVAEDLNEHTRITSAY